MRLIGCFLFLIFCGNTLLLAESPIRIGVEIDSAPLSYVDADGNPAGFSAELLEAMVKTGGLDIEIVPGYWTNLLKEFEAGRIDVLANVTITDTRRQTMAFSISHAYVHGLIYYPEGNKPIRHTADLAGKTIGALKGSIAYQNAMAHDGWGAKIVPYASSEEALEATRRGECDASIFIRRIARTPWLEAHGMDWEFVDDIVHQYHFAVHKGDARTLEKLNEALATVRANGTFDRIYAKWIGPLEPHPIRWADLKPYYLPGGLVLLVIVGFILWQRHMMGRLAKQQKALRSSEERWKFAIEGAGDGVWDWTAQTDRVLLSKRWWEMLGYGAGMPDPDWNEWMEYVHPDDLPTARSIQKGSAAGEGDTFAFEHRLKCRNGSWKWVLSRGMVVSRDTSGQVQRVLGTHADLTDIKQIEENRLVLGKLESTGVLAGGIAHDFNNLLTAIILNLDLARYNHDSPTEMLSNVTAAEKAAMAARGLTQQLITFAKGGATVVGLSDIGKLLKESVPLMLSGSNVKMELSVPAGLWSAEVDEGQIGQVIRNLVLNAREAMPTGGVIAVTVENISIGEAAVRGLQVGDYLKLTVNDTGEGIAPEDMAKIFDPYFSTKQRGPQKGMGLGLTICHSIVQKHHGAMTVESELGRGTCFYVYLPASRDGIATKAESPPPFPKPAETPLRILVMDDEEIMRDTLGQILREMGHVVELHSKGESALVSYYDGLKNKKRWDLVLLDLTIPGGMGGRETFAAMRQIDPTVCAIVMTGYTNDEIMRNYASVGFHDALPKPFTADGLRSAIAGAIRTA